MILLLLACSAHFNILVLDEAATDTGERTLVALLVPLLDPETGADGRSELTERPALVLVALVGANEPLVVPVPAMQGLVRRRETFVARRGAHMLDHVKPSLILLAELGGLGSEDLHARNMRRPAVSNKNENGMVRNSRAS